MNCFRPLLLTFILLSAFGCQNSTSQTENHNQRLLKLSIVTGVRSLDPSIGIDNPSVYIVKMLFEGLMTTGLDGKVKPGIAESYEISEDLKSFTFHLRPSKWTNGDALTAYDFEYSWKRVIDPQTKSVGVHNFYPIKNARRAGLGEVSIDSVGIKALDAYTLQVELENPTPYFLELVTTSSFFPVNSKVTQENPTWANQEGSQFVCNGPFLLEKHRLENEIIVRKNPAYWDAEHVKLPGISIAIIKDVTTQLNLFEKHELDWLGNPFSKIPLDAVASLKAENKLQFINTLGIYWCYINTQSFPFQNKKMRQAFSYGVCRNMITKHILQCNESPALGVLPLYLSTQKKPFFEDDNKKVALQLFNEALEEMGITKEQLPEITINYPTAPPHLQTSEALQEEWNELFGINIKLEQQDWKAHYEKLQKGSFQIGSMGWLSFLRDPIYIMQAFRDKSDGVNMAHWENKDYQELLTLSEQEVDQTKRKVLFNRAEALLMDEMPVIPLYFATIVFAKNDQLKDVYISDLNEVDFRWAYFEE